MARGYARTLTFEDLDETHPAERPPVISKIFQHVWKACTDELAFSCCVVVVFFSHFFLGLCCWGGCGEHYDRGDCNVLL